MPLLRCNLFHSVVVLGLTHTYYLLHKHFNKSDCNEFQLKIWPLAVSI